TDQAHRDAVIEGLGYDSRLAISGEPLDADLLRIHLGVRIGFEVVDQPADTPLPGPQCAPVIRFARLTLVGQADDSRPELIVIGLNARRDDGAVAPALSYGLLGPGNHRWAATARPASKTPKFDHDRHGAVCVGRYSEARLDVHRDLRIRAIVDMTN